MNKKGFTLIELLAVIVILAVIALIVTPIVTGIISQAKTAADARSVEGHVANVGYAIVTKVFETGTGDLAGYEVTGKSLPAGLTVPANDTVKCGSYTISNGVVTAATGCAVRDGDTVKFKYSNTEGASKE